MFGGFERRRGRRSAEPHRTLRPGRVASSQPARAFPLYRPADPHVRARRARCLRRAARDETVPRTRSRSRAILLDAIARLRGSPPCVPRRAGCERRARVRSGLRCPDLGRGRSRPRRGVAEVERDPRRARVGERPEGVAGRFRAAQRAERRRRARRAPEPGVRGVARAAVRLVPVRRARPQRATQSHRLRGLHQGRAQNAQPEFRGRRAGDEARSRRARRRRRRRQRRRSGRRAARLEGGRLGGVRPV